LSPISDSMDEDLGGRAERGHELRGHLLGQLAEVEGVLVGGPASRSSMSRTSAGSTNRSADGIGICMITKATDVARPGRHRLGGDHGIGAKPAREGDGQDGVALALRPNRVEQHVDRDAGEPVRRVGRDVA